MSARLIKPSSTARKLKNMENIMTQEMKFGKAETDWANRLNLVPLHSVINIDNKIARGMVRKLKKPRIRVFLNTIKNSLPPENNSIKYFSPTKSDRNIGTPGR